jgi:single stranded DNA-binding protein
MNSTFNTQTIVGHLGDDPSFEPIKDSDRFEVNFRVATNHSFKRGDHYEDHTEWFNVRTYCSSAQRDTLVRKLHKGTLVYAQGTSLTRSYEGRDGQPAVYRYVLVDYANFRVLSEKANHDTGHQRSSKAQSPTANLPPSSTTGRTDLMNFD